MNALIGIGYRISIPVTAEQFSDPVQREQWREEKGTIVLKLWSDEHRRTPIDVFIYEPFDFATEYAAAQWEPVFGQENAPVVRYATLLEMKRSAGRPQDLADICDLEEVEKLRHPSAQ